MFRKSIAAAVLVAGAAFVPAAAQAVTGYTTERTELLAGPDYEYPVIRPIGGDRRVEIFGCLNDWSFCDVGYRSDRGWVDGRDVMVDYRGRRASLYNSGAYVGIGFVSFSFGTYWDNYYRGRPFYRERTRWERHYHDHWRSSWGRDRDWRDGRWNDRDRRDWNDRDRNDRDRRDWNDRDRRDNDRRGDNDRPDRDRTSYKGAPNNPAVTPTPSPQPRPGLIERDNDRPGRGDRDNDRGRDRNTAPQSSIAPQPAPMPTPGNDRPDRGAGNDRPDRGGMGLGNRQAMERPQAAERPARGMNERRERSQNDGQRENREPRNRGKNPNDEENRPGR